MVGKVFEYIKKNFIYIFPFLSVGGLLFAGLMDYEAIAFVVGNMINGKIGEIDFFYLFRAISVLNFSSWYYFLISLALLLAVGVVLAMELAFVEKHMRIGKRTLNGLWDKINDNFISSFIQILIYISIYEVWALLTSTIIFAIVSIFKEMIVAQYILAIALFILFSYVILYGVHIFYLWLPCAEITGFTFFESLKYASQLVSKVRRQLMISFIVNMIVSGILFLGVFVLNALAILPAWAVYLTAVLLCCYLFTGFTIGQEVVYFETDQLERADLPKVY